MKITVLLLLVTLGASVFAQKKADFSAEWARDLDKYSGGVDALEEMKRHDVSGFWLSGARSQNGVYDSNYQRIEFHLSEIIQDTTDQLTYKVKGKYRLKDSVELLVGTIRVTKALRYTEPHEMNDKVHSFRIIASYEIRNLIILNNPRPAPISTNPRSSNSWDGNQFSNAIFRGTLRTDLVYTPSDPNTLMLDQEGDDGYMNNTFVGIWTTYILESLKKYNPDMENYDGVKCIWGLERLPFTEDWDEGAGEIYVNKKYVKNGWENYMRHNELTEKNGVIIQKDMWWK
jgi:hypothetical protein